MATKRKMVLAVLATTLTLSSMATMAQDHNRGNGHHKEFRVCTPYKNAVVGFSDNLANFQDEVIAPLARELSVQQSKVDQRLREESKLESVVRGIDRDISSSERRLQSIPGLIIGNTNLIASKKSEIANLQNDIVRYENELSDAGWIRKKVLKGKIKKAKKNISKAEKKITNAIQDSASMKEESRTIPARIISLRSRLSQADQNLAAHRNLQPSLDSMRDQARAINNRLDSQEVIRDEINRKLTREKRKFTKCQVIDSDAQVYSHLGAMVSNLQDANCNVAVVRERLPYTISKAQKRALAEANAMVCAETLPPVTINQ